MGFSLAPALWYKKIFLARDKIDLRTFLMNSLDDFRHRFVKIQLVDYDYDYDHAYNCDYYSKREIRTISQSPKNKKRSSNGGGGVLYKTKTLVKNTCNITLLYFFLTIGYSTQIFHLLQFYMHACGTG